MQYGSFTGSSSDQSSVITAHHTAIRVSTVTNFTYFLNCSFLFDFEGEDFLNFPPSRNFIASFMWLLQFPWGNCSSECTPSAIHRGVCNDYCDTSVFPHADCCRVFSRRNVQHQVTNRFRGFFNSKNVLHHQPRITLRLLDYFIFEPNVDINSSFVHISPKHWILCGRCWLWNISV